MVSYLNILTHHSQLSQRSCSVVLDSFNPVSPQPLLFIVKGMSFDILLEGFEVAAGTKKKKKRVKKGDGLLPKLAEGESMGTTVVPYELPQYDKARMREESKRVYDFFQLRHSLSKGGSAEAKRSAHPPNVPNLAVLICIVADLPTESIWRRFASQCSSSTCTFHIHAAQPSKVTSQWVRDRLIPVSYQPKWNDVRVVRALLALIREAIKNENVTHMHFATESCVPALSLSRFTSELQNNKSYLSSYGTRSPRWSSFDNQSISRKLTLNGLHESILPFKSLPGWITISRLHAEFVLEVDDECKEGLELWRAFEDVWAPEEVFFATSLAIHSSLEGTIDRVTSWAQWDDRNTDFAKRANPLWFDGSFNTKWVGDKVAEGALVVRKFKQLTVEQWENITGSDTAGTIAVANSDSVSTSVAFAEEKIPPSKKMRTS